MKTDLANFKLRTLASILEFFIFLFLHSLFWVFLSSSQNLVEFINRTLIYLAVLVISPLGFLYNIIFTHYFGGTLGKLLTGLKIVKEDGSKLPLKMILFRQTAGYQFASTLFGLGYFSIVKDPKKQGWHDKTVGSKVIVKKSLWPTSTLLSIILLLASLYLIGRTIENFKTSNLRYEISSLVRLYQIEQTDKPQKQSSPSTTPQLLEN